MGDAWLWWLFIQLLGLACLPLTFTIFANLPDRGWALSKSLGVLSFCFLVWFPLTLPSALPGALAGLALPYARGTLLAFLLLLLAVNGWLARSRWHEIVRVARSHTGYILVCELLFAGAFALLIWIRSFIPDVYGTEKFMDEAFVSAIMRSPHLPPNDPWLSGYTINYYYLGHFIVATIAKLLGTSPAVAFNTGIALIFALMAVNLFGVTTNAVALLQAQRQRRAAARGTTGSQSRIAAAGTPAPVRHRLLAAAPFGLAAVLFSLVFSNLFGASEWLDQLGAGLSFDSGVVNVLALLLTAASIAGLVWEVIYLLRRWRNPDAGTFGLKPLIVALGFSAAMLAVLPWCISRLAGVAAWFQVGWPQISNWLGHPQLWASFNWWNPSRAVHSSPTDYQNITEFPAFSFLLADLHAHVLALPFTVLALGVALNLLLARGRGLAAFGATTSQRILSFVSAAVIIGGLYAMNGWDLPTYAGLALLCLAAQQWRAYGRRFSVALILDVATLAAVGIVLGFVLYLPFIRSFSSPSQGIGVIPPTVAAAQNQFLPRPITSSDRTAFADFWSVFGLFLTMVGGYLVWQLARACIIQWRSAVLVRQQRLAPGRTTADDTSVDGEAAEDEIAAAASAGAPEPLDVALAWVLWGLLAVVLAGVFLLFVPYSLVLVICLAGVVACAVLAYRRLVRPGLAFTLMLAGTALALMGVCEVVYLRDVFDHGELFRMNTIFKLYYQAWTLFSVSGGALLYELVESGWRISREHSVGVQRLEEEAITPRLVGAGAQMPAAEGVQSAVGSMPASTLQGVAIAPAASSASEDGVSYSQDLGGKSDSVAAGTHGLANADAGHPTRSQVGRGDQNSAGGLTTSLRVLGLGGKLVWMFGFLVLALGALVYPVFATDARTGRYHQQVGLDGAQYLEMLYPGDAAAIRWINTHIGGDPVIVEATGREYSDFARVSTFTGLPTVLGWGGHEVQWRVNWLNDPTNAADFNQRSTDLDTIYTSTDAGVVMQLLHRYHASYLYVGTLEQQKYPKADPGRFSQFLSVVYQAEGVTIYRIP